MAEHLEVAKVKHYNPSIAERGRRLFNSKGTDGEFSEIDDVILPTISIAPITSVIETGTLTNGASSTLYTVPQGKTLYITGLKYNLTKDATSTSTYSYLSASIGSAWKYLVYLSTLTTTAQQLDGYIHYEHPIRVDRGTNINLNNETNVANIKFTCQIFGYFEEVTS